MSSSNDIDPRRIDYAPLGELRPNPRNPKDHHLDTIDSSIGRFGVLDLIVRDERTGYIISGHGRHQALTTMQARGEAPPEGVRAAPDGTWLIPIVTGWASRSDAEASAALIALNRTTELGGWVDDSLLGLLEELAQAPDGLEGVGFDEDDIAGLRARLLEDVQAGEANTGHIIGNPSNEFQEIGDDLETDYRCPKCSYEWSGALR